MQPDRNLFAYLFLLLWAALAVPALPQTPSGVLRGTVQDGSGGRIAGAEISISDAEKSYARKILSDDRGEFRISELPPDSYQVVVSAKGFAEAIANVAVPVSSVREILITLKPEKLSEKVFILDGNQSITSADLDTSSAVHQAVIYRGDLAAI